MGGLPDAPQPEGGGEGPQGLGPQEHGRRPVQPHGDGVRPAARGEGEVYFCLANCQGL